MSLIHFKLVKSDGHTRRVTFEDLPPWHELASKLYALYNIPVDNVGISYVDDDGDEITGSSNEELQDFYRTSYQPGKPIRFKVIDLSLPRESAHSESFPPNSTSNRNTFGEDPDGLDFPEWQRFTVAEYLDNTSEGPHAFVEIVNSDVSGFAKDQDDTTADSEDGQSTVQPAFIDKGKQKAYSPEAASTASVMEAEFLQNYPVHSFNDPHGTDVINSQGETAIHSSPKVQGSDVNIPSDENGPSHDDPPLPTIESPQSNASVTLTSDVATLLSNLSNVISSHPELSEGIRNIVDNAVSGAYWQEHRAALSQAANSMQQATSHFEQEAAQRVSEAIGNIFRSFSQSPGNANETRSTPQQQTAASEGQRPFPWQPPFPAGRHPLGRRHTAGFDPHPFPPWHISPWFERGRPVHFPPRPPGPPPQPPSGPFSDPGNSANNGPFPPFPPPPPPPPPPFHLPNVNIPNLPEANRRPPSPPPGLFFKSLATTNHEPTTGSGSGDRFPPPPRPVNERPDYREPHLPSSGGHRIHHFHGANRHGRHGLPHGPSVRGAEVATASNIATSDLPLPSHGLPYSNPFLPHPHIPNQSPSKPTSQQLRAQVEEAKRVYKDHKEMYRREREERKNEKGGRKQGDSADIFSTNIVAGETSGVTSHIVSKAWGSYPQLEMYSSGPTQHNTHPGPRTTSRDDLTARAQSRIARRLADMGFSENSHPDLPAKIKTQMQSRKVITKEEEDDIVTNLLEELLALASKSPVATGSGARNKTNNEGWGL